MLGGQGGDCYMFRLDADVVLDATQIGNIARYINHCCTPNCYSKVVEVAGKKHIVIFAARDLGEGEEVTYDYKFQVEAKKIACPNIETLCNWYVLLSFHPWGRVERFWRVYCDWVRGGKK